MSRGPGAFQVRVLETLALYDRLGPALNWTWRTGGRYALGNYYVDQRDVERWERQPSVPLWILRRDLGCDRAELSRALRSLYRRGLVWIYTGALDHVVDATFGHNTKYAKITDDGRAWLDKRKQSHSGVVGTYEARP